jgi:hypothetical protein
LFDDLWLFELELLFYNVQVEGLVLSLTLNDVDVHGSFLESSLQASSQCSLLEVSKVADDFDLADVLECFSPFALVKVSCCEHNIISAVLRCKLNSLLIILLNELSKVAANNIFLNLNFVFRQVWNF